MSKQLTVELIQSLMEPGKVFILQVGSDAIIKWKDDPFKVWVSGDMVYEGKDINEAVKAYNKGSQNKEV